MNPLFDSYGFQSFSIVEGAKKSGVLAIVEGPHFAPNLPSRNKRVYSDSLWTKQLSKPSISAKITDGLMLGTVGHKDLSTDDLINEGRVAVRVQKLWIDEATGLGMGRTEILDTPVGRILHTLMIGGSKMATSSKASGGFTGKKQDGNDIVDEDSFDLERFDFVTDPGFLEARPQLREALEEALSSKNLSDFKEDTNMEAIERLTQENIKLVNQIGEFTTRDQNQTEELTGLRVKVAQFETLGTYDALKGIVESEKKIREEFGDHEKIKKTYEDIEALLASIKQYGTIQDIDAVIEDYSKISQEFGTFDEIKDLLAKAEEMKEALKPHGEVPVVLADLATLKTYKDFFEKYGPVEDVQAILLKTKSFLDKVRESNTAKKFEEMAAKYGITIDKLKEIAGTMPLDKVEAFAKEMVESLKVSRRFKVDGKDDKDNKDENEDKDKKPVTRVGRMFESFSK